MQPGFEACVHLPSEPSSAFEDDDADFLRLSRRSLCIRRACKNKEGSRVSKGEVVLRPSSSTSRRAAVHHTFGPDRTPKALHLPGSHRRLRKNATSEFIGIHFIRVSVCSPRRRLAASSTLRTASAAIQRSVLG